MIFLLKNRVVKVETDVPICFDLPCPSYGANQPVDRVIELAAGEIHRLRINKGDYVRIKEIPFGSN